MTIRTLFSEFALRSERTLQVRGAAKRSGPNERSQLLKETIPAVVAEHGGLPAGSSLGSHTLTRGADFELRPVSSARPTQHIKRL